MNTRILKQAWLSGALFDKVWHPSRYGGLHKKNTLPDLVRPTPLTRAHVRGETELPELEVGREQLE